MRRVFASTLLLIPLLGACRADPPLDSQAPERSGEAAAPAGLDARLARLCDALEARRVELHVPGMALAVVKDDAIVLARGFGLADLENMEPATAESLFAIGSTTKAFTAAVVAMQIDAGRMAWDDPVTSYLPYFALELDTDDPNARLSIADALSHRSGFMRMSLAWASGDVTREEVLRTAARAEAWRGYRKVFLYNNVMVMAAGEAAGVAAGSTWDELVRERILAPLGMTSTVLSTEEAQRDPRLAKGYTWDADRQQHVRLPMRHLGGIAPAGSINSNAVDVARWLRLMLARGAIDGERLIDDARFDEMWSVQTPMGGGADYGLGWMLREWNGRKVVEHGGNIDGFAAQVGLLPEERLGYVLLCNVSATPLQQGSLQMVWEHLLGAPEADAPAGAARRNAGDYTAYLGRYQADFGALRDTILTVQVDDTGALALDVPGQTLYALKSPDARGRWVFAVTDTIAVSFDEIADGRANVLVLHQGGLDLAAPREGWEYPVEIPLDQFERYLGRYAVPDEAEVLEVVVVHNHLAVDVPGQLAVELLPPVADGTRTARMGDRVRVRFVEADGRVASMLFIEGDKVLDCPRLDPPPPLLSLAELHARRGSPARAERLAALGGIRASGRTRAAQSGVRGTYELLVDGARRARTAMDFGRFGWIRSLIDGADAHQRTSLAPARELSADEIRQARHDHPLAAWGDWRDAFTGERIVGRGEVDGRPTLEVHLRDGELPIVMLDVDLETGDVLRWRESMLAPDVGQIATTIRFDDYRDVEGARIPFKTVIANDASGRIVIELDAVEARVAFPPNAFERP
jgi:CubicO group peptidase (beta-lactamase class C family)